LTEIKNGFNLAACIKNYTGCLYHYHFIL